MIGIDIKQFFYSILKIGNAAVPAVIELKKLKTWLPPTLPEKYTLYKYVKIVGNV